MADKITIVSFKRVPLAKGLLYFVATFAINSFVRYFSTYLLYVRIVNLAKQLLVHLWLGLIRRAQLLSFTKEFRWQACRYESSANSMTCICIYLFIRLNVLKSKSYFLNKIQQKHRLSRFNGCNELLLVSIHTLWSHEGRDVI